MKPVYGSISSSIMVKKKIIMRKKILYRFSEQNSIDDMKQALEND